MINFQEILQFVTATLLLLAAAHTTGRAFAAFRQPRVIGEIIGGLLLGPTLLSYLVPDIMGMVFAKTGAVASLLTLLSQTGLVLLMYTSGAHLRSFVEPGERKVVAVLALAGIAVPFLAGLAVVPFLGTSDLIGSADNGTAFLLVFATAIAIASIPVISRIMLDLGIMETTFARIVIATAVIDDIVLYVVLAVALGLVRPATAGEGGLPGLLGFDPASAWSPTYHVIATILLVFFTMLAGTPVLRRAFRSRMSVIAWDNAAVVQLVFLALVTLLSSFLVVNPMFGALAAGMVAGRESARLGIGPASSINRMAMLFFVPIYFALVGFKLDLIHHFTVIFFVGFIAFACIVKSISIYAGARLAGETHNAATNLAAALNARGGPGIVLASVAYDAQIINENFFAILVLTAIVTSLLAGSWLGRAVRRGTPLRGEETVDAKKSQVMAAVR